MSEQEAGPDKAEVLERYVTSLMRRETEAGNVTGASIKAPVKGLAYMTSQELEEEIVRLATRYASVAQSVESLDAWRQMMARTILALRNVIRSEESTYDFWQREEHRLRNIYGDGYLAGVAAERYGHMRDYNPHDVDVVARAWKKASEQAHGAMSWPKELKEKR